MARRVNADKSAQEQGAPEGAEKSVYGVIEEGAESGPIPGASTEIVVPGENAQPGLVVERRDLPPAPLPKRYRVVAGPSGAAFMHHGYKTMLRDGKVVDETTYPISVLRAQGVRLQEIEE